MTQDARLKEMGSELHERLLVGGDSQVTTEIAELFLPLLAGAIKRRHPNLNDPHLAETAAIDSLIAYFRQPEKFDPGKGSLIGYLYMDAEGDLLNLLKRQQKSVQRQRAAAGQAYPSARSNDPEMQIIEGESALLETMRIVAKKPVDLELLELMMDGVRETGAYAEVLGIQSIPVVEQAVIVKRHKDRLKAALRRGIEKRRHLVMIIGVLAALRTRIIAAPKVRMGTIIAASVVLVGMLAFLMYRANTAATRDPSGASAAGAQRANSNGSSQLPGQRLVEKILFTSDRAAQPGTTQSHIWMMNTDGSAQEQVTFGDVNDRHPDVSQDGARLLFTRKRSPRDPSTGADSIWVRYLRTGVEIPVTLDADQADGYSSDSAVWSPDGARIAVERNPYPDHGPAGSIWVVDFLPAIGALVRLTPESRFGRQFPAWSGDGKYILFMIHVFTRDGPLEIHRIEVESRREEQVIPLVVNEYLPAASREGGKLAWISFRHAEHGGDVYVADLADPIGSQRRLTPESGWQDVAWSPDNKRLVLAGTKYRLTNQSLAGLSETRFSEALLADLAKITTEEFLRHDELTASIRQAIGDDLAEMYEYRILQHVDWHTDLWVVDADGSNFVQLTTGSAKDLGVCWTRIVQPEVDLEPSVE